MISYSLSLLLLKLVESGSMLMRILTKYGLKTDIIGKYIYMPNDVKKSRPKTAPRMSLVIYRNGIEFDPSSKNERVIIQS